MDFAGAGVFTAGFWTAAFATFLTTVLSGSLLWRVTRTSRRFVIEYIVEESRRRSPEENNQALLQAPSASEPEKEQSPHKGPKFEERGAQTEDIESPREPWFDLGPEVEETGTQTSEEGRGSQLVVHGRIVGYENSDEFERFELPGPTISFQSEEVQTENPWIPSEERGVQASAPTAFTGTQTSPETVQAEVQAGSSLSWLNNSHTQTTVSILGDAVGAETQTDSGVDVEIQTEPGARNWGKLYLRVRRHSFLRRLRAQIGEYLHQFDDFYQS